MARIKFSTVPDQFNGSIGGQTFYSGAKISTIRNIASQKRKMSPAQMLMSSYLIAADRHWRQMTPENRALWNLFATTYPQRTNRFPLMFLSGYELFVKRNQHYQIFAEHTPRFMDSPNFIEYLEDLPVVEIYATETTLTLDLTFPSSNNNLDCFFSLSAPISPGQYYPRSSRRMIALSSNVSQTIDITNDYLAIFGKIPNPLQVLNFQLLQIGSDNGQYFFPETFNVIVQVPIPPIIYPKNGLLYNWYTVASASPKLFAPIGWKVPTDTDYDALATFLGGLTIAGGPLKQTDLINWDSPNTGATNSTSFNGIGSGLRDTLNFTGIRQYLQLRTSNSYTSLNAGGYQLRYNAASLTNFKSPFQKPKKQGMSCRWIKLSSDWSPDETMIDNNGNAYQTVKIGSQVWTCQNSKQTSFRDGTVIPEVTAQSDWNALTTPGLCAYNNDWNNV